jgi:hypothetical protein
MATSKKLVLSYNICFEAMTNSQHGASIGKECTYLDPIKRDITFCGVNIANMIDKTPNSMHYANFDFVGLQEASKCNELVKYAPGTIGASNMGMILSKAQGSSTVVDSNVIQYVGASMATFYDKNKYTLIDSCCSQFSNKDLTRPFHILLLQETATNDEIIFINVHTPHGHNENLKYPGHYYSSFETVAFDLSAEALHLQTFDPTKNYRIIMTGDFNETGWDWSTGNMKTKTWSPLKNAGVMTSVSISQFVFSCSQDNGDWESANGQRGGDYIFDSEAAAAINYPSIYNFFTPGTFNNPAAKKTHLQSDHLPVVAEL